MDERNSNPNEAQEYAAIGESLHSGLPPEAAPAPAGEPLRETPLPGDPAPQKAPQHGGNGQAEALMEAQTPEESFAEPEPPADEADVELEVRPETEALAPQSTAGGRATAPEGAANGETPAPEAATPAKSGEMEKPQKDPTQSFVYKLTHSPLWQPILRPVMALVVICAVTSLLLGLTNALTEPVIAANTAAAAETARMALLPQAGGFEAVEVPSDLTAVTAIYRATGGEGWVVEAYGRGYGGKVPALIAFDESGNIAGVSFLENSETVGLGQKVREPAFYEQFAGRPAQNLSLAEIDKIASATISSNAALSAVNAAVEAYQRITGGGEVIPATLEEALPLLLPGETLAAIQLPPNMPGAQATAYRSSTGNYIIVGTASSSNPSSSQLIIAAVAMTPEGNILNLWLDTSGENYGAALATNPAFLGSFSGQSAPVQVDVVAGVTGSSDSVITAVNNALGALPLAKEAA